MSLKEQKDGNYEVIHPPFKCPSSSGEFSRSFLVHLSGLLHTGSGLSFVGHLVVGRY